MTKMNLNLTPAQVQAALEALRTTIVKDLASYAALAALEDALEDALTEAEDA